MSPKIQSTEIFKAIEAAIPATLIEQAIAKTKVEEERHRSLPAHLLICLVIAMSLWSRDSMRDVLKNLIDGLSEAWVKVGKHWQGFFLNNHNPYLPLLVPSRKNVSLYPTLTTCLMLPSAIVLVT